MILFINLFLQFFYLSTPCTFLEDNWEKKCNFNPLFAIYREFSFPIIQELDSNFFLWNWVHNILPPLTGYYNHYLRHFKNLICHRLRSCSYFEHLKPFSWYINIMNHPLQKLHQIFILLKFMQYQFSLDRIG